MLSSHQTSLRQDDKYVNGQKKNEFGETFVYFLQMKRYLRLSKKSAVL